MSPPSKGMRTFGKILLIGVLGLAVLICVGVTIKFGPSPFLGPKVRPLTDRKFESTPARLERGRYIFTSLSACARCHTPMDLSQRGYPPTPDMMGAGQVLPQGLLPGRIVAPNLTSDVETGAGSWTDDQLARAIREGIGHDGRTLFPIMPYQNFREMSDEDLASVIVFLRSLPAIHHELPKTEIKFPISRFINALPKPVTEPVSAPDSSDPVVWGKHLVRMAGCPSCHTPTSLDNKPLPGMDFAGGMPVSFKGVTIVSGNLTPDASGIAYYDEATFMKALRTGYVGARPLGSAMPFVIYGNLTDDDMKAMFAYLRTIQPVHHRVDNSLPPTYCKLCRHKHGAGDQNR
jgi:mono/diheme cytochrome c family protein